MNRVFVISSICQFDQPSRDFSVLIGAIHLYSERCRKYTRSSARSNGADRRQWLRA